MAVILTTAQIQDAFDIKSSGTMSKIKGRGADVAVVGRNQWDLRLFIDWWMDNMVDSAISEAGDDTLAAAKVEYWKAKSERERIKADRDRGELILVNDVHEGWSWRMSEVKQALLFLTERFASTIPGQPPEKIRAIVTTEVRAILENFCREGTFCHPGQKAK
jgi:hypothetical protein